MLNRFLYLNVIRFKTFVGKIRAFFMVFSDFRFLKKEGFTKLEKFSLPNWNYNHGSKHTYKFLYSGFMDGKKYVIKTDNNNEAKNEYRNYLYVKNHGGIKYIQTDFMFYVRPKKRPFFAVVYIEGLKRMWEVDSPLTSSFVKECYDFLTSFSNIGLVHCDIHTCNVRSVNNHLFILDLACSEEEGTCKKIEGNHAPGWYRDERFEIINGMKKRVVVYDDYKAMSQIIPEYLRDDKYYKMIVDNIGKHEAWLFYE